ncbi:MAG: hypothetical protein ACI9OJ_002620, partial [Myxococcota bacterium]
MKNSMTRCFDGHYRLLGLIAVTGLWITTASAGTPILSGDVEADFSPAGFMDMIVIADLQGGEAPGEVFSDIDYYDQAPDPGPNWFSGVDVKDVRLIYDPTDDTMYVGLNFFGIAGDMDGNGDPSAMALNLAAFGDDFADWAGGESWVAKFDLKGDSDFELVAGVSGVEAISQFAVREPFGPDQGFGGDTLVNHSGTVTYLGTSNAPDIEFTVINFCQLLEKQDWAIRVRAASLQDGLEEESVPNSMAYVMTAADIALVPAFQDDDNDGLPNCNDPCQDLDGDGFGAGPGCPDDCDESSVLCNSDCSDLDADAIFDCKDPCIDVDEDGFGSAESCGPICADDANPTQCKATCEAMCIGDCDDTIFACNVDCTTDADDDSLGDCEDPCVDIDGDGYGDASACGAICDSDNDPVACTSLCQSQCPADCDPLVTACNDDCSTDVDSDDVPDCKDPCIDVDDDGFGNAAGCAAVCAADADPAQCKQDCEAMCLPDCNDAVAECTDDCTTDADNNDVPDCEQTCVDKDGDGYGEGDECLGEDCDDTAPTCTVDCVTDEDDDDIADCKDPCIDSDGDNHGDNSVCKTMCANNVDPANCMADCDISCPADCDETSADCTDDCAADVDMDSVADCKDSCLDPDGDTYGIGDGCTGGPCDCDEGNAACNTPNDPTIQECVSSVECLDADNDGEADCREPVCDDEEDIDGDLIPNCDDDDDDGDGLDDVDEPAVGTDPKNPDTDGDGLKDGEEVNVTDTDPNDPDTDDGGVGDGKEVEYGTDPRAGNGDDDFKFEYFGGGGCQQTRGGSPGPAGFVVVALMLALGMARRRNGRASGPLARTSVRGLTGLCCGTILAATLLTAGQAQAQREGLGADTFIIKPGADRIFMVEGSEIAPAWQPYGGIWFHYAKDPLALRRSNQGGFTEDAIISNRVYGEVSLGVGLFDYVELDVTLPVVLHSDGSTDGLPSRFSGVSLDDIGAGDVLVRLRGRIIGRDANEQGFGFTVGLTVGIPTGDAERFQGDGRVFIQPNTAFTYGIGPAVLALNLGFNLRTDDETFANLNLGSEMTYGFGALYRINDVVRVGAEVFGRWNLQKPFDGSGDSPLEITAGPRLKVFKDLWVEIGAGAGVVSGYGTPDFRLFAGVQWAPMVLPPGDRDGDGYTDEVD